jgi:drug/metabolite transporter (DMT)-like permease
VTTGSGAALALLAALAFGSSSPLVKRHLGDVPPLTLSGLLYLGAGSAMAIVTLARAAPVEARLRGRDFAWLAGAIASGGVLGPFLLLLGLARTTATAASLLLNVEVVLTVLLAALVFNESIGRRLPLAAIVVAAGSAVLSIESSREGAREPALGALLVIGACFCWAIDNNLTQRISHRDPFEIVRWKGLAAGCASLGLAAATGTLGLPGYGRMALALGIGALSYGLSIVLYTYAQRGLGAARSAAYFGTAPFLGAALAIALGEPLTARAALGGLAMAIAGWLLLAERHTHRHVHEPLVHDHRHVHDEHHQHAHRGDEGPEPHSHEHAHAALDHEHDHAPDLHHRHRHAGEAS